MSDIICKSMAVTIGDASGSAVIDSFGAQLMSLKNVQGLEYLWQRDPQYWSGCAPVLFPIVGKLKENTAHIDGKEYTMQGHGFARISEFSVVCEKDNEAVFSLRATPETRACYPFEFELLVSFKLENGVLTTGYEVRNEGDQPMPFAVGGHPAFNVPLFAGEKFDEYRLEFSEPENAFSAVVDTATGLIDFTRAYPVLQNQTVLPLEHKLFYQDALVFDGLKSASVKLEGPSGHGVEMDISQFPMLGIWSAVNDGPYVCLEPWTGCADCAGESGLFEEKRGMRMLAPGGRSKFEHTVRIF